ncbi:unnamed protein product [Fraxinus pennsylvanica]|uniref:Uncharacterized protein n=1 Tax=Fraxinus pennsylvanica TaxID=56036 RepID=A0AAD1YW28_9LAMI|nr:unnamed protein product [Fraxinus pennsylvanica]
MNKFVITITSLSGESAHSTMLYTKENRHLFNRIIESNLLCQVKLRNIFDEGIHLTISDVSISVNISLVESLGSSPVGEVGTELLEGEFQFLFVKTAVTIFVMASEKGKQLLFCENNWLRFRDYRAYSLQLGTIHGYQFRE